MQRRYKYTDIRGLKRTLAANGGGKPLETKIAIATGLLAHAQPEVRATWRYQVRRMRMVNAARNARASYTAGINGNHKPHFRKAIEWHEIAASNATKIGEHEKARKYRAEAARLKDFLEY